MLSLKLGSAERQADAAGRVRTQEIAAHRIDRVYRHATSKSALRHDREPARMPGASARYHPQRTEVPQSDFARDFDRETRLSRCLANRARRPSGLRCLFLGVWLDPRLAWGRMGHRASARLAESRLSPRARAIIRDLLEPGESLADASTWADENSREIPGSAGWHFVNVPISAATLRSPRLPAQRMRGLEDRRLPRDLARSPRPTRRGGGWRCVSSSISSRTFTSRCTSPIETIAGATTSSSSTDVTTTPICTRSGIRACSTRAIATKPNSCVKSKTWPISPSRPTGSKAVSKTGPMKAWKSADAPMSTPSSNRTLRTGDSLGRDYERANLPAGHRSPRAFRRQARFSAQRDPQVRSPLAVRSGSTSTARHCESTWNDPYSFLDLGVFFLAGVFFAAGGRIRLRGLIGGFVAFLDAVLEGTLAENLVEVREAIFPDNRTAHRWLITPTGVSSISSPPGRSVTADEPDSSLTPPILTYTGGYRQLSRE